MTKSNCKVLVEKLGTRYWVVKISRDSKQNPEVVYEGITKKSCLKYLRNWKSAIDPLENLSESSLRLFKEEA